ncbi:MAG: endo-1,4-beta-xylanase [Candidatus Bathyarchaeota archaeon]|nr:endo-1,4-beta-xylanase [Candidatus Bathyarchaeota archaeon]
MRKEACLIIALLITSAMIIPVFGLQSSQSIQSYGTISYQTHTELMYGVCGWPWTLTERDFQEAKNLGVKYLRMDFPWGAFEYYNGATFTFTEYDRFVTWAKNNDIEIIPILCNVPSWYNTGSEWKIPTGSGFSDFVTRFGNYVYRVVDHYKADIKYFEIWNEPNIVNFWNDPEGTLVWDFFNRGSSVQKYVTLLQTAYTQAKLANPNSIIISGGLAANDDIYLQQMYNYGAKGYFDLLGLHPYFKPNSPTINYDPDYVRWGVWDPHEFPKISLMKDVMEVNGDTSIDILITELGVGDGAGPEGATTEAIQARALTRVFEKLGQEFPYVIGCMWFHLRTDMENYGLLRENYIPRQMYYAYRQIIT